MRDFSDLTEALAGLSPAALIAVVILAAFVLSGFTIHTVCKTVRERRK
jgi:hypothetical protein